MAMTRIEIEIDDELVAEVMNRYGLMMVTEAVNYALRELAGPRLARQFLDGILSAKTLPSYSVRILRDHEPSACKIP